jgi:rhomboid protease GluP
MTSTQVSSSQAPSPGLIVARTHAQAMDWSLALASQGIACVIHPPEESRGWALEVEGRDVPQALQTLKLYLVENRRKPSALTPAVGEFLFHWGVLLWCLLLVMVYWAVEAPGSNLKTAGVFDTEATARGDYWRPVTATFLHHDADHLAANLTTGFLLIGLAMGRFRVGPALLGALLAGTGANLFAWAARGRDYIGLGASGVVMAALGMLAFSLFADARAGRISMGSVRRALIGGVLLFILLGASPQSDVLAHAGGFILGAGASAALASLPARVSESSAFDLICALSATAWIWAMA